MRFLALSTMLVAVVVTSQPLIALSPVEPAAAPSSVLWYAQPARSWMTEALPLGNGSLGGMLFGLTSTERIQSLAFTSGTSGWFPNPGRSAMADSIWGPWTALGNPCRGTERENAVTFESQSTYVLPVPGRPGEFIYMGDRWRPKNAIDGRHVWLPVEWENNRPVLRWHAEWDLSVFTHHNTSPATGK